MLHSPVNNDPLFGGEWAHLAQEWVTREPPQRAVMPEPMPCWSIVGVVDDPYRTQA